MKYAARMFAMVMLITQLLASAQLGTGETLTAKVPFQFLVGNKVIPAGQCVVRRASPESMLIISNWGTKASLISPASKTQDKLASSNNALVFHRYGDRYFLTGIKLEGSKTEYRLPEARRKPSFALRTCQLRKRLCSPCCSEFRSAIRDKGYGIVVSVPNFIFRSLIICTHREAAS